MLEHEKSMNYSVLSTVGLVPTPVISPFTIYGNIASFNFTCEALYLPRADNVDIEGRYREDLMLD